jgi:hypothetical protein
MDPLQKLRAKISDFPGYSDELDRRRSDELVRSYMGEALAELAARLSPLAPACGQQIEALLLRVGFADPHSFAAHNGIARDAGPPSSAIENVAADDMATIDLADRAASIDALSLPAYLDEIGAVLDRRDAAMRATAS